LLCRLDWREHVVNASLYDQLLLAEETQLKQRERLWQAQYKMEDVARMMVEAKCGLFSKITLVQRTKLQMIAGGCTHHDVRLLHLGAS